MIKTPDIITCQLSANCLCGGDAANGKQLTSSNKRSAEALCLEFNFLIESQGLKRPLFITTTFADPVPDRKAREQIYLNFRKYFLEKYFRTWFHGFRPKRKWSATLSYPRSRPATAPTSGDSLILKHGKEPAHRTTLA